MFFEKCNSAKLTQQTEILNNPIYFIEIECYQHSPK